MTLPIPCASCNRSAFRLVGNTVQVTARHDGGWHITSVSLADLNDMVDKEAMRRLLDKIGVPVLE